MENKYIIIFLIIPIIWFFGNLFYSVVNLFYLWIKYKFENIKIKEYQIWD
tara:strand:- start:146 stop:295 length:150 start_codon:yes stop_codon:yes gene_type:complete